MRIVLILLAAGNSRRFCTNKLLYELDGKPMYLHLGDKIEEINEVFWKKIVVTQYEPIGTALKDRGYQVVWNTRPDFGISHSIWLAVEVCETLNLSPEDALCFAVCDQPYVTKESLLGLLEGFKASKKDLGCLAFNREMGNPVLFRTSYMGELKQLHGDIGGKKILKNHPGEVFLCEVKENIELKDMDTQA